MRNFARSSQQKGEVPACIHTVVLAQGGPSSLWPMLHRLRAHSHLTVGLAALLAAAPVYSAAGSGRYTVPGTAYSWDTGALGGGTPHALAGAVHHIKPIQASPPPNVWPVLVFSCHPPAETRHPLIFCSLCLVLQFEPAVESAAFHSFTL